MKTFNVYAHPTRGHEAVKTGFSWPALFFGLIWMLLKRLWGFAGLLLLALISLRLIEEVTNAASSRPVPQALVYFMLAGGYLAAWLVPASKGNAWRESNLIRRGYELLAEVRAETPDAAIAIAARSPQPTSAPSPPADSPHPTPSTPRHFNCKRCHHRVSEADAAWDRLVADRCCPRCREPATFT